ncbi:MULTISPECIES: DUF397 domain-containing protein [Actinomadura]|uniref:DUF397 domain-containing protein n=1 Tax=Actinomadura yumaensis TaxID=111807 RepID=A0ABW2CNA7_9ACTN|nr:DUF397 domain-containing protein [Actinomadura sp. J1-007]MWK36937.1 DUF397 domain-containing protein [Actinomadura sp. J1-007]
MTVQWRKSSFSGGVNDEHCVELGRLARGVGVRDSKDPDGGHLALTVAQLGVLLGQIKDGQR